ncbi:MAG: NAD(P)-dependent oxidoreductase [Chloroflexi bacterium]|nr:NAD(P)-dependent oxidoreductase [Chloroflexota bacterium]
MSPGKSILVTGASGLIGGLAARDLSSDHTVTALNRRAVDGIPTTQADLTDLDAIRPAFDGIDTVVHMAAYLGPDVDSHFSVNVRGTYNVLEAARQAGVKRVVFGSSGATTKGHEDNPNFTALIEARWDDVPDKVDYLDHTAPVRPGGVYGAVKVAGEALGRAYSDEHGLSVICIRIGRVIEEDRPASAWHASVYLSHRDIAQAIRRCVEAPDDLKFDIIYAVSDNKGRWRDIEHARQSVGYVPQDGIRDWPLK